MKKRFMAALSVLALALALPVAAFAAPRQQRDRQR